MPLLLILDRKDKTRMVSVCISATYYSAVEEVELNCGERGRYIRPVGAPAVGIVIVVAALACNEEGTLLVPDQTSGMLAIGNHR